MIDEELTPETESEPSRPEIPETENTDAIPVEPTAEVDAATPQNDRIEFADSQDPLPVVEPPVFDEPNFQDLRVEKDEPAQTESEDPVTAAAMRDADKKRKKQEKKDKNKEKEKKEPAEVAPAKNDYFDKMRARLRRGTAFAAYLFLAITVAVFVAYQVISISWLYKPALSEGGTLSETLKSIFGYFFGLLFTLGFLIVQLPLNIITLNLFGRIVNESDKKWVNVVYLLSTIFAVLLLLAMIVYLGLFIGYTFFA